ncbi:DNA polymerase alpha subunit B [Oratosquilla oratoria]|uniref:DNA polymerase alpha subunit B n=1 Tax=Oratosquilla oratoria TaxID=337810 RepID=UPI003F770CCF
MAQAEEIIEDFETFGVSLNDDALVGMCVDLCSKYDVTGEQIAACWLGFANKNSYEGVTMDGLQHFEREELAKQNKKTKVKPADIDAQVFKMYDASTIDEYDAENNLLAAYGGTPTGKGLSKSIVQTPESSIKKSQFGTPKTLDSPSAQVSDGTTPLRKFSERTNSGAVVASYGDVGKATWTSSGLFDAEVSVSDKFGMVLTKSYKYMFEKLRDIAEVHDDIIEYIAENMKGHLGVEEWTHVRQNGNECLPVVGRICCDSVGRLNVASVLLEGSRASSGGLTVPLDVTELKEFSLFPGQVVAIQGVNSSGSKLVAQNVQQGLVPPIVDTEITLDQNQEAVQVMIASGPFTTTDDVLYEPLMELLNNVTQKPPHVLILIGPFLDSSHPFIVNNSLNETYTLLFNRCLERITSCTKELPTEVLIVSSYRDVMCPAVYPTPPIDSQTSGTSKMKFLSDPSFIEIEGVTFALTSTDILFHIGKEEISFPHGSDRMCRLAKHLLAQQSMYPLYPPPLGVNIDHERCDLHARLPNSPHVLVLPSNLRGFIRDVEGVVVVNPEHLAKGQVGGAFARLELRPPSKKQSSIASSVIAQVVKL